MQRSAVPRQQGDQRCLEPWFWPVTPTDSEPAVYESQCGRWELRRAGVEGFALSVYVMHDHTTGQDHTVPNVGAARRLADKIKESP